MYLPRLLTALILVVASGTAWAFPNPLRLGSAEAVSKLISTLDGGAKPIIWYGMEGERNLGSAGDVLVLNSGGSLAGRGMDPWGRVDAAFGPGVNADFGAAIAGSGSKILIAEQGSCVVFFQLPKDSVSPVIIFSRSDWGKPGYFSLRVRRNGPGEYNTELGFEDKSTSQQARYQVLDPIGNGAWTFAALSWKTTGSVTTVTHWAGSMGLGNLYSGSLTIPNVVPGVHPFVVGGRRKGNDFPDAKLVMKGGLLCHFALCANPLSDAQVRDLYETSLRR